MNYESIIEFTRQNKSKIIDEMKQQVATQFISRVNHPDFDDKKEMAELKIEERALSRTEELIETVIEKMEKGEKIC